MVSSSRPMIGKEILLTADGKCLLKGEKYKEISRTCQILEMTGVLYFCITFNE
jgi:hypothetical protein